MPRLKQAGSGEPLQVTVSWSALLKILAVVVGVVLFYLLHNLVLVVATSVVIASAVQPAANWFLKYRIPRTVSVLLIYLLAIALFFVLVPLLVLPVLGDLGALAADLGSQLSQFSLGDFGSGAVGSLASGLGSLAVVREVLFGFQSSLAGVPVEGFLQVASLIFGGLFSFILIVVISFYLAVQKGGIESFLRLVTPLPKEQYIIDLWERSQRKIGLWSQGQILLGLIVGVLVYLGLTILQVKYALVLAVIAALFELIPFFGPVLSAVPAVLLGFSQSPTIGLMVIGLYAILQQFENQLIYPLVVNKIVGVPALLVILFLIIGGQLAGFLGLILAVPAAAVLMELADDWTKSKHRRQQPHSA